MAETKRKEMTLENQIESIQEILKLFDNPLVIQLPEKGQKIQDLGTNKDLYDLIARNIDGKCGLHFCPNGSRGRINKVGEKTIRKDELALDDGIISAFVLDFDYKDYKDKFETKEKLLKRASGLTLVDSKQPRFVMDSGGGAHVYYFIKKDNIEQCNLVFGKNLLKISEMATKIYDADKGCIASFKVSGTIRLPYSYNNKYKPRHMVVPSFMNLRGEEDDLTFEDCERLLSYIDSHLEQVKKKESLNLSIGSRADIDSIPMEDMIEKLKSYPRTMPDGRIQVFEIKKDNVIIYDINENNHILKTTKWNSYKFNKQGNYVHCFCFGDPLEAPEGNGFGFLYYYFCKNITKVDNFLQKEYGLSLNQINDGVTVQQVSIRGTTFYFAENAVKALSVAEDKDKETTNILFNNRIIPKGKGYVKQFKIGETEEEQFAVVFEVDGKDRLIIPKTTKRDHNRAYPYMFFYNSDNQLAMFFRAIELCEEIPRIKIYEKNGYYDDVIALGGNIVCGQQGNGVISTIYEYNITEGKEQVSAKEFLELYKGIYDPTIVYPTFLQALALAGMNLRDGMNCYPAMLVTGLTGSGKTSVMQIIKSMLGYADNARTFSLPGLTPQPLKQAAGDFSVLFLEELTNKVGETTEELLRNIVNHDKASRGHYDQNVEFNLFSPLMVVGERTFKDESLNNRFVTVVINRNNWVGDSRGKIQDLLTKTAFIDIYKTRRNISKEELSEMYRATTIRLSKRGLDSRNADTYAYMFVTKNIFNIGISDEYLYDIVDSWIKKTGVAKAAKTNDAAIIKTFLLRTVLTNQANITVTNEGANVSVEVIFLNEDIYEKNKGKINTAIYNFNQKMGKEVFTVDDTGMFCNFVLQYSNVAANIFTDECKDIALFRKQIFDATRSSKMVHYFCDINL